MISLTVSFRLENPFATGEYEGTNDTETDGRLHAIEEDDIETQGTIFNLHFYFRTR